MGSTDQTVGKVGPGGKMYLIFFNLCSTEHFLKLYILQEDKPRLRAGSH